MKAKHASAGARSAPVDHHVTVAPQWFVQHHLKLRHLTVLVTLHELGTVSATAARLHTTQPAISRVLAEIEAAARMRLFERRARGITPTAAGDALASAARDVFGVLERSARELTAIASDMDGSLAIGCNHSAAASLVPRSVMALMERRPRLSISVREGERGSLLEDLRGNRLDVVVARLDPHHHESAEDLNVRLLWDEPLNIVCAPEHPLARQRRIPWKALGGYPWIMPMRGSPVRAGLDEVLKRHGVHFTMTHIECTSSVANQVMLRQLGALAVMTQSVAEQLRAGGQLAILPVRLPLAFGKLAAMTLKHRPHTEAVVDFLACLRRQRLART